MIRTISERMVNRDLARLFENAFPNTLDTTVRWHVNGESEEAGDTDSSAQWRGPQTFIVTGDINAEWLRDSTNQLAHYHRLAKGDQDIYNLILGAINTQAEFVIESPYCNAFQPPPPSRIPPTDNAQDDIVHPVYEPARVFECKYELDSLAHFLALANDFHKHTGSTKFLTPRWYAALEALLTVVDEQSRPTFDEVSGAPQKQTYRFQRKTIVGTETLSLDGVGNPLNSAAGLIRSAFRPSDDATILGYHIPSNAMLSVELARTAAIVAPASAELSSTLSTLSKSISDAIWEHAVFNHSTHGRVFAYEIDGYGSSIFMDDANIPSLLALPHLGFCSASDPVYKNTRALVLSRQSNPYYFEGPEFQGIGGPHVGLRNPWPMSLLIQALTSDSDEEISDLLTRVKYASPLGLLRESVNMFEIESYTRSWFAWANSLFAYTILDVAERKPHLIFGSDDKGRKE